jgi:hypothetical protein
MNKLDAKLLCVKLLESPAELIDVQYRNDITNILNFLNNDIPPAPNFAIKISNEADEVKSFEIKMDDGLVALGNLNVLRNVPDQELASFLEGILNVALEIIMEKYHDGFI